MFSRFYGGFGFGSTWKNYDGWSTPMLKVFLTQAGYSADTELVQTGYPMSLPIKGYVVAGDNLIAYDNANALLVALANTELGDDYLAFYSTQIAASGEGALFNPNNLGLRHRREVQHRTALRVQRRPPALAAPRRRPRAEFPRAQGGDIFPRGRHGSRRNTVTHGAPTSGPSVPRAGGLFEKQAAAESPPRPL